MHSRARRGTDRTLEEEGVAEDKENAEILGAHLVILDESGFLLIHSVRRTWTIQGWTPIHRHHQKREKASVISAL